MGNLNLFCNYPNDDKKFSQKMMRAKTDRVKDSKMIKKFISTYDIDKSEMITPDFEIKNCPSFNGMSELNHNNCLYLCGGQENQNGGTYLLKFDPTTHKLETLINSKHYHHNPTLCIAKGYLYCIGGEDKKAERYNLTENYWEDLPSLKLERSGSTAYFCEDNDYLYLFGGFLSLKNNNTDLVIRIKVVKDLIDIGWEDCFINKTSPLIKKSLMCVIPVTSSTILLVGGDTYDKQTFNPCSQVVKVDFKEETIYLEECKLKRPSTFLNRNSVLYCNNNYAILFDEQYRIHKYFYMEKVFVD